MLRTGILSRATMPPKKKAKMFDLEAGKAAALKDVAPKRGASSPRARHWILGNPGARRELKGPVVHGELEAGPEGGR